MGAKTHNSPVLAYVSDYSLTVNVMCQISGTGLVKDSPEDEGNGQTTRKDAFLQQEGTLCWQPKIDNVDLERVVKVHPLREVQ
jgi:hypothetical protein